MKEFVSTSKTGYKAVNANNEIMIMFSKETGFIFIDLIFKGPVFVDSVIIDFLLIGQPSVLANTFFSPRINAITMEIKNTAKINDATDNFW
jgi:hypothetical protein